MIGATRLLVKGLPVMREVNDQPSRADAEEALGVLKV
jgi:hypothetical protein